MKSVKFDNAMSQSDAKYFVCGYIVTAQRCHLKTHDFKKRQMLYKVQDLSTSILYPSPTHPSPPLNATVIEREGKGYSPYI